MDLHGNVYLHFACEIKNSAQKFFQINYYLNIKHYKEEINMSNKRKLSKTVLEMKFMKRSKIQQEKVTKINMDLFKKEKNLNANKIYFIYIIQHDDENENIEVLTDQRIKGERQSYFVIEKNWEIIENLKCSRLNYGMSSKKDLSNTQTEKTENNYNEKDYKEPKKKQIRLVAAKDN